jgi:predicted ATPase
MPDRPALIEGPYLSRVSIRNYKSIDNCTLELGQLAVLVGRNGAGKSNFLDALRFVSDSLNTSLDHAIRDRGGIDSVRRRSTGHPRNFGIAMELFLPNGRFANYCFEVAARSPGGFQLKSERLYVRHHTRDVIAFYEAAGDRVRASVEALPALASDRLFLVAASSLRDFREVYDALSSMGFYNLNPDEMKEVQPPDAGEILHRDGGNIASVVARMARDQPETMKRIIEYLAKIVPGITDARGVQLGPKETLQFRQRVIGSSHPWKFFATSISDGTLRALGALVAANQFAGRRPPVRLIGIEEPETALHPAAASALMDALLEASGNCQIIMTSHSPDLLDSFPLAEGHLFVVVSEEGTTRIAPADKASLDSIRDHLYSAGDLLRMDQLEPDRHHIDDQRQRSLFES